MIGVLLYPARYNDFKIYPRATKGGIRNDSQLWSWDIKSRRDDIIVEVKRSPYKPRRGDIITSDMNY